MSDQSPVARYLDPIRQYLRSYVKDDDDLLEHVLIACLSSYTSSPLNLGVMGPSSAGKTYVISLVTKLFPNAVSLTGASAKSFFYEEGTAIDPDTHEDLQGKIDDLQKRVDGGEEGAKSELRLLRRKAMIRVNLAGRILVFKESPG
ncbi:MAG: hypothetical protein KGO96_13200, partial [Elusimicrobia bacterium]|nr:hypothetical protein [Elusimicrobiota bacterium]